MTSRIALSAALLLATPAVAADDETIVVTASRSGDPVRADLLGSSVTVLDAKALEDRQTRVVSDILRDVPGLAVSRAGGPGGITQVRIRGAEGNHTLTLIDGIEVSDPYQGEFDYGSLIADDVARIEVLRGQQSALYGSDAIGGVIHYITLTGREAPGFSARAEGGSFGSFNAAARAAGVSGALDYALSASYLRSDGTPTARNGSRDIGVESVALSFKSTLEATEHLKVTAVGRYSDTDADTNNSEFDTASPLFGFIVDTPGSHARNRAFYGLVKAELSSLDDRLTNAVSAQIADTKRDGYASFGRSSGDKGRRTKASYDGAFRFGSDTVKQRITLAVDAERERYQNTDPSGFAFTGRRHADNLGIVGQYDVTVNDALALGASLRRDENDRFADATTYRLQGSYRLDSGTRLRAAAGSGIKNPGFYELYGFIDGRYIGNPNLKPEKSEGWEAGVAQAIGEAALVGVTYFRNRLKDEIVTRFPAPLFVATPSNSTATSRQRGVEAFAQARLGGGFRLDASYTYLHAREAGLEEVRRAPNIASLNLDWREPEGRGGATLTVRHNGKQDDVAFTNPTFIPVRVSLGAYTLVNLAADWKLTTRLSLFGRVENLLAEDYEDVFSYATPGRAAYAGVKMRF